MKIHFLFVHTSTTTLSHTMTMIEVIANDRLGRKGMYTLCFLLT